MSSSIDKTPPKSAKGSVKELPTFTVTSRPASSIAERDDNSTIHGVRSIADLSREVLKRLPPKAPSTR